MKRFNWRHLLRSDVILAVLGALGFVLGMLGHRLEEPGGTVLRACGVVLIVFVGLCFALAPDREENG